MRLAALSPSAARAGLDVGIPLAEARASMPDLIAVPHDPAADAAAVKQLGDLALDYSPLVEGRPPVASTPATLVIDITGCDHLFGGEAAMARQVCARLRAAGFTACAAIADTPDAARALARYPAPNVAALPLTALDVGDATLIALRRAGMRRVGDIIALPRAALAARFGTDLLRHLARLLGEEDSPFATIAADAPIQTERRFAEPIARVDDVLAAAVTMITQVGAEMTQRGVGGRCFTLALYRSDGHIARLSIETAAPTRDPALVLRLLRERIDSLSDPLDPGFGYDVIALAVPSTDPLGAVQNALDDGPEQAKPMAALLDRLAVRHGSEQVLRFSAGNSHVPERAAQMVPWGGQTATDTGWIAPAPGEPPARPVLLFDPPQRLEVLASVPDGPPRRFRWRGQDYRVARAEGPERIAPEWWRRAQGHAERALPARDYYRVEEEAGGRFWVFRAGLAGQDGTPPRWYMHGLFA